jgi:hypothetical protein
MHLVSCALLAVSVAQQADPFFEEHADIIIATLDAIDFDGHISHEELRKKHEQM